MFFEDGGVERRRTGESPVPLDPAGRRKGGFSIRNGCNLIGYTIYEQKSVFCRGVACDARFDNCAQAKGFASEFLHLVWVGLKTFNGAEKWLISGRFYL
jgi:hypothetical protein